MIADCFKCPSGSEIGAGSILGWDG